MSHRRKKRRLLEGEAGGVVDLSFCKRYFAKFAHRYLIARGELEAAMAYELDWPDEAPSCSDTSTTDRIALLQVFLNKFLKMERTYTITAAQLNFVRDAAVPSGTASGPPVGKVASAAALSVAHGTSMAAASATFAARSNTLATAAAAAASVDPEALWRATARRLLIVGAMWERPAFQLPQGCTLVQLEELVKAANGFCTLEDQAAMKCFFDCESVPLEVVNYDLAQLLSIAGLLFANVPVFSTEESLTMFNHRHVDVPEHKLRATFPKNTTLNQHQPHTGEGLPKVMMVGGESGSGKTCSTIVAASAVGPTFYFRAADINTAKMTTVQENHENSRGKPHPRQHTAARNRAVMQALLELILEVCPQRLAKQYPGVACIIVDEIGGSPGFVHGMCAIDTKAIQEHLQVKAVRLFAVGTGLDNVSVAFGSEPTRYERIAVDSAKFDEFVNNKLEQNLSLRMVLQEESQLAMKVQRLRCNARVAALLLQQLNVTPDEGDTEIMRGKWRCRLRTVLPGVMSCFHKLNGLADLSTEETMQKFQRAVALSCSCPSVDLGTEDLLLVTKYGILTDQLQKDLRANVRLVSETVVVKEGAEGDPPDDSRVVYFLAAGCSHRYAISAAQVELGLANFGISDPEWSGHGFERLLCDLATLHAFAGARRGNLALCAGRGRPDPLWRLKKAVHRVARAANAVAVAAWSRQVRSVRQARVAVVEVAKRASGGHGNVKRVVVVLRNCDKAPFADIIIGTALVEEDGAVVVQSLVLVQAKHYPRTTLELHEAWHEMFLMGAVNQRSRLGHKVHCSKNCLAQKRTAFQEGFAKIAGKVRTGSNSYRRCGRMRVRVVRFLVVYSPRDNIKVKVDEFPQKALLNFGDDEVQESLHPTAWGSPRQLGTASTMSNVYLVEE